MSAHSPLQLVAFSHQPLVAQGLDVHIVNFETGMVNVEFWTCPSVSLSDHDLFCYLLLPSKKKKV